MSTLGFIQPLPQRPNLDLQRKLAKQLLRDAWSGEPVALARVRALFPEQTDPTRLKLHDTQLVIARGYGFDSWAALKHKIESLTRTPLEQFDAAVREGDTERARELLLRHADIRRRINEPRFDFNSPAIHQAKQHLPMVDLLLEHGADINARSTWWAGGFGILEWNLTPEQARTLIARGARVTVWAAAGLGLFEVLKSMVQESPQLVHERGGDGKTALHCAASAEIAALLLDHGADPNLRDIDHGSTPLQYLIEHEDIARRLIERGAETDIFAAVRLGDRARVEHILRCDPGAVGAHIGTPPFTAPGGCIYIWTLPSANSTLEVARAFGHEEIVRLLLDHASLDQQFMDALWCADEPRARALLQADAALPQRLNEQRVALMAEAAWAHRVDAVRLMLEMGLDPHIPTVHRSTPLDRACFHGYERIVEMLLKLDPNPPLAQLNEFGGTPLEACLYGAQHGWDTGFERDHARTLQRLLDAGSPIDPTSLPTGNETLDHVLRTEWTTTSGAAR